MDQQITAVIVNRKENKLRVSASFVVICHCAVAQTTLFGLTVYPSLANFPSVCCLSKVAEVGFSVGRVIAVVKRVTFSLEHGVVTVLAVMLCSVIYGSSGTVWCSGPL